MMNKDEAVQKLATVGRLSMAHAEDLYDSFFEKPVVPQYVVDWYEENKDEFEINLFQCIDEASENYNIDSSNKFWHWLMDDDRDALTILVNMHQFGYEVEKETKYKVKLKGAREFNRYLNREANKEFLFADERESGGFKTQFTRKELERSGFGWVFNCEGVEIEEVE
mgnify:CR=1 FL=1